MPTSTASARWRHRWASRLICFDCMIMQTFTLTYPRTNSMIAFALGIVFVLLAVEINRLDSTHRSNPLFWLFLIVGIAAALGSFVAFFRPPLVLLVDATGISFGSFPRMGSRRVHVSWRDIRVIESGRYSFQFARKRHSGLRIAVRIECDDSIDLTGCGDGVNYIVGTAAEIRNRTDWRGFRRTPRRTGKAKPKNIALISASYFSVSPHEIREQLEVMLASSCRVDQQA